MQAGSHVKLRKNLNGDAIVAFEQSLKRVRDKESLAKYVQEQRSIARESELCLVDPAFRGRGIARQGRSGRPKGRVRKEEEDKRE